MQHRPCCQWQLTTCGCTSVLSLWAAVSICARSSEALTADAHAERVDGVLVSRDVGDEVRLALARCGRAVVRLRIGPHVVPAEPARDPSDARPSSSVSCVSMRTAACVASRQPGRTGRQAGRTVGRGPPRPVQQKRESWTPHQNRTLRGGRERSLHAECATWACDASASASASSTRRAILFCALGGDSAGAAWVRRAHAARALPRRRRAEQRQSTP